MALPAQPPAGPLLILPALLVLLVAALAAVAPLALYTVSLAAFGLVHVLCELRYVDARFSPRLPRRFLLSLSLLLMAVVLLRVGGFLRLWGGPGAVVAELGVLAALVAVALPHLRRFRLLGVAVFGALLLALFFAPLAALPLLALLHNLTPVGFLAEALPPARRRKAMAQCALVFLALPALLATGIPGRLLGMSAADPLGAGPLLAHLPVFLPRSWSGASWATPLFSAAAFLQVMHYVAVVYLLPRLTPEWSPKEALVSWPAPRLFHRMIAALAALLFVAFALSFRDARAFYGIAASVHAWVEIPLLVIAPELARPQS